MSENLADEPTSAEVAKALGKLRNGKVAGTSNILPEILKVGGKNEDFVYMPTDLLTAVWVERKMRTTRVGGCHSHPYNQEREFVLLRQSERHSTARCGWEGGSEDCPDQGTDTSQVGAS